MLPTQQFLSYKFLCSFIALFLFTNLSIHTAQAQSGRNKSNQNKQPQTNPQPPPSPPPAQQDDSKSKQSQETAIPILVVFYRPVITNSGIFSNVVTRGCLERLQQSSFVKAGAGSEMNRKEAYDFAKASKDTYVLWFQLESDIGASETMNNRNIPSVVDFVLFSPATGKTKTSGHVYTRPRGSFPTGIPTTNYPGEYQLQRAGQDLADRILDSLSLPKPPHRI